MSPAPTLSESNLASSASNLLSFTKANPSSRLYHPNLAEILQEIQPTSQHKRQRSNIKTMVPMDEGIE